jgi:hypothetical protein
MFAPKPPFPTITGADGRPLEPEEQELLEIYDKLIPEIREDVRDYASEKLELQELRKQMGC